MTSSDANPIQFWGVSDLTYNETEVCGVNPACWCQPIDLSDSITLQFTDDSSPGELSLVTLDENGAMVAVIGLTESPDNVYQGSPSFPSAGLHSLIVIPTSAIQTIIDADTWTVETGTFTSRTASNFVKNFGTPSFTSTAYQDLSVADGGFVNIKVTVTITGTWVGSISASVALTPNGVLVSPPSFQVPNSSNVTAREINFVLKASGGSSTRLYIILSGTVSSGSGTITATIESGDQVYVSPLQTILKSDCLDVRADHPCSNIITYTNASDYAGLKYTSLGNPTFNIRVPSVFFHEEFTEEEEDHELSNNTIIEVWSKITRKKRFDIAFVPYYFHMKLKLILAHQSLTIQQLGWIKRKDDPYEIDPGSKRYPLKKATVMLTDKNFIKRNLI